MSQGKHTRQIETLALGYRALLAHYLNLVIPHEARLLEIGCGDGELLARLDTKEKTGADISPEQIDSARRRCPEAHYHIAAGESLSLEETFDYILISDTLNFATDAQAMLEAALQMAAPETRLVVTSHNTLWRPIFAAAASAGLCAPRPDLNWLSVHDIRNLAELAGWEMIKEEGRILLPVEIPFLSSFLNRWIAPFLPFLCMVSVGVARPRQQTPAQPKSVSVVIPARNEAGNIAAALARTPQMGAWTELIFVEGNSTDNTWDELRRIQGGNPGQRIKIARQPGKGKGDAVRTGFALAEGDILMILDADLTMPPEDLPKFYAALARGDCEFANGCRLVYPMEKRAMQFLNLCANKLFGCIFSWMLGQQVKDTLCGTKVISRANYEALAANRSYFGEFDPFGDFDLLFGADKLNLKIRDIPVRYRERTYGSTNIHRFRHGIVLFRMIYFAARKLKFV